MKENIFRQYDIRGKVDSELNLDQVYDLGLAIAFYFIENKPDIKTVAIGMDGRTHSPIIKDSLSKAIMDSGLDVVFIGICPTPVVHFSLHEKVWDKKIDAGLMITASHNPKEYNGIKISLGSKSIWGQEVQKIKSLFINKKKAISSIPGKYYEIEVISKYIDWLKEHFKMLIGSDISAVVDSGNGVGGTVMPQLIEKMGWKNVQSIFDTVDGNYPNHEADPTIEENMSFVKNILATTDVQVGIGFDGDCDRMAPMTKSGELVTGDKLLAVYAEPILKKQKGAVVICDIKASSGLEEIVESMGGRVVLVPSGVSNIKTNMIELNSPLGGELSCHFFFTDRHFGFDDAFYAMMRLFEIMVSTGENLGELISVFPKKISTQEIRMECVDSKKGEIVESVKLLFEKNHDAKIITTDGVKVVMSYGWGILRASNTQPVLSLRFESSTQEGLDKIRGDFLKAMSPYFEEKFLKEQLFI
ncbi:MAG: Phosphomannomutase [candidate division TM6 bacterium GW2011_GWF2_30_66]|jgi:phosphomannomutase/phosphoglucomutase|nr:MAG: Phosphomannomutase [candidate division TM6 bacterium GW2011_GWF2_30_66]